MKTKIILVRFEPVALKIPDYMDDDAVNQFLEERFPDLDTGWEQTTAKKIENSRDSLANMIDVTDEV